MDEKIKIALLVPIGRLDKFGYQHNYKIILDNLTSFADKVFVASSSYKNTPEMFSEYTNLQLICDKTIDDEKEINYDKIDRLFVRTVDTIKQQGYDVIIEVHINQYIPDHSLLRKACEIMIEKSKPFEFLYKKYQLGNIIFNADVAVPWILNLTVDNPFEMTADSITNTKTKDVISIKSGNYKRYNDRAIIDVIGEFTLQEAKEKHDFTIRALRKNNCTYDSNDESNLVFDEKLFLPYHINKINNKVESGEKLNSTGSKIVNNSKSNFLSHYFIKHYAPKNHNIVSRLINKYIK